MPGPDSNRCYRLRQRPSGRVTEADLELVQERLHGDESVVEGFGAALTAMNSLFDGGNTGNLLVRLADPDLPVPTAMA